MLKKYSYILSCLMVGGLALASLASCQSVLDPVENNPQEPDPTPAGQAYFLAINVFDTDDVETRATFDSDSNNYPENSDGDVFNKGLGEERAIYIPKDENDVYPHYLLFFNSEGKKVGNILPLSVWQENKNPDNSNFYTSYKTLYTAFTDADVYKKLENSDVKSLVVLNASESLILELSGVENYDEALKITIEASDLQDDASGKDFLYFTSKEGKKYFTMSSSMVISGGTTIPATEGSFRFYSTPEDAVRHPYIMYVERLQAKYTVLFEKRTGKPYYFHTDGGRIENDDYIGIGTREALVYTSNDDFTPDEKYRTLKYVKEYTRSASFSEPAELKVKNAKGWKVNIAGWGVNGIEKQEYLFKNLTPSDEFYSLQDWWYSSFTCNYRNYWAEGKHYKDLVFPDQYRTNNDDYSRDDDSSNKITIDSYKEKEGTYPLNYFPYSQLRGRAPHQYSPEHTFDVSEISEFQNPENALNSKAHLRASTHIIICAQLLIEGLDGTDVYTSTNLNYNSHIIKKGTAFDETTHVKCKIFMDGYYWNEDAWKEYVVEYLGYCMLSSDNQAENKFGPNDGIFYAARSADPSTKFPAGKDQVESVAVNIKGGDGYVRVSLRKDLTLYTYDANKKDALGNEVKEVDKYTLIDRDKLEKLILDHPEYFGAHYYFGRMYYSIPVKHNTASPSFTPNSTTPGILTGDYGSVRNHWYYFRVQGINCPGTSVADPAQKIIPNNEPEYETLSVSVGIFRWHQESTDVNISGQLPGNNGSNGNN